MKHLTKASKMLDKITSYKFKAFLKKALDDADWLVGWLEKEYRTKPVIVGGMAVQQHGYRRMTEDIDILVSSEDYKILEDAGKIKFGQLKIKPGIQIDVLAEGKDGNPDPEFIREGDSYFPTLAGLIYMKLLAGRMKDQADVVELLKINNDPEVYTAIFTFLPPELEDEFIKLMKATQNEQT